ncbi:hypothetical protein F5141DRAFT_1067752 [Pisolithus sp. B1]|nr:hypothetical protein F5141DRAFT_1067752 [Pisolithus sp. B1]
MAFTERFSTFGYPSRMMMMFNAKSPGFIVTPTINRPLCCKNVSDVTLRSFLSELALFISTFTQELHPQSTQPLLAMDGLYHFPASSPVTLNEEFLWTVVVANAEEIDQMLQTLRSAIVYASQWCNSFAPAARLQGDILLLIFEHALPDRDTCMLRTLSQVCHQWRSTVLQAPLLWCKALNLADRTTWFSEVLGRTQTVPLEVFFDIAEDYTSYVIPNLATIMMGHFWRCTSLHIEGYRDDIEEIVSSCIMTDRAPLLHWLSIHNISCSVPSVHDGEAEIPDAFLSVFAPQLMSLHLEGCAFNWDVVCMRLAPHTPLLSSLHICNFHIQSAASVAQLLSVLESLPCLKDPQLQNSFTSSETDWNTCPHKVLLSQLTSLIFESSAVAGAMFLAALELLSLTKLEATIDIGQPSTDIHKFMEGVWLATCRMAHLPYLYIYYGHRLLILHSNHHHCFSTLWVTFKNWALHDPAVSDTCFTNLIRGIADVAVLQKTQDLKVSLPISIEWHLAADAWAYFFSRLKKISFISFGTHCPVFLICTLLLDACCSNKGTQVQSRLLPSLMQITLPSIPKLKVLIDILADARGRVGIPLAVSTIS